MIKRILIVLSALLSVTTFSVSATGPDVALCASGEKVVIAGKSCSAQQSDLFMAVAFPGVDIDTAEGTLGNFSQVTGTSSDAYGNFDLSYVFEGVTPVGVYTVHINDGCSIDGHRYTFNLPTQLQIEAETANLNSLLADNTKVVADYESFISSKADIFGISLTGAYAAADKAMCWEYMKSLAPFADNIDAFCAFNRALNVTKIVIASNKADVLGNYILFADDNTKSVYSRLTDSSINTICSKLDNVTIENIDDKIRKMMITELFNQAGRGQIQSVLSEFAAELGMDITQGSAFAAITNPEGIYVAMANKTDYADADAVRNHFTGLVANPPVTITPDSGNPQTGNPQGTSPTKPSIMGGGGAPVSDKLLGGTVVSFTDLDNVPWAEEAINALYSKNVVSGVGNNKYNPDGNVKREEFVKMLVIALGYPVTDGATEFADVDSTQWYAPYIKCAVENGIVNGVGDGLFGVGNYITRQDMAVMIDRIIKNNNLNIIDKETIDFSDNADFADYATEAIKSVSSKGIMTGTSADTFAPRLNVTRAMAAVVIYRII